DAGRASVPDLSALRMWKLVLMTLLCAVAQAQTALAPLPCSEESSLASPPSTAATPIDFENQTSETVQVFWLNFTDQRVFYEDIGAGASFTQQTYVGHTWVIADSGGTCIQIFE